ncbi:MAG: hypothetical protein FJZ05_00250 [Candidatus Nealsonbacteria bacterium]|nr:hypothetical protein [Candidatus Nealsonbacteria bacterium]
MEIVQNFIPTIKFDSRGGHNRYKCNFSFFEKWTDSMAYVLGFLYADGTIIDAISSRTQYVKFTSIDREIIEKIKMAIGTNSPIYVCPPKIITHINGRYKSKESFALRIGNRRMFNNLICLGLVPNKSKVIEFPNIPLDYLNHFVRGYFDGDGCLYLQTARGISNSAIVKKLSVIFTSGSLIFLKKLSKVLKTQLILGNENIYISQRAFQLRYSMKDSLKIFKFLYKSCSKKLCLRRKFDIFSNYFKFCPQKIDMEINSIFKNLS